MSRQNLHKQRTLQAASSLMKSCQTIERVDLGCCYILIQISFKYYGYLKLYNPTNIEKKCLISKYDFHPGIMRVECI